MHVESLYGVSFELKIEGTGIKAGKVSGIFINGVLAGRTLPTLSSIGWFVAGEGLVSREVV